MFLFHVFRWHDKRFESKRIYWRQLFYSNNLLYNFFFFYMFLKCVVFFSAIHSFSFDTLHIWISMIYFSDYCNVTAFVSRYLDFVGIQMQIQNVGFSQTLQKNTFTGTSRTQFSNSVISISGTVDGDCTGSIDFPQLGGNQLFAYHRENCSTTMSSKGIVLHSRESECPCNIIKVIICLLAHPDHHYYQKCR